jgi:uncharacterized protein (DUF2062 family)
MRAMSNPLKLLLWAPVLLVGLIGSIAASEIGGFVVVRDDLTAVDIRRVAV